MKFLIYTFIFIGGFSNCIEKKNKYIPIVNVVQDSANNMTTAIGVGSAPNENSSQGNEINLIAEGNTTTLSAPSATTQNSELSPVDNSNSHTEDSTNNTKENSSESSTEVNEENEKVESNSSTVNSIYNITPTVSFIMGSTSLSPVSIQGILADNHNNTLSNINYSIYILNSNGEDIEIFSGNSSGNGAINGEFSIPMGYSNLYLIVFINGVKSQPVSIPVSIESECKGDHDRGHGNDSDGIDEDNPGKSKGISANAMENRRSNGKIESDCESGIKYISRITKISLPI